MPNIMDEYIEKVGDNLDSPKVFIEASAYHIISSCLGRFFHCSQMPGGKLGARPNIWILLSSIPGRTRRSTLTEYCQYVYKNALKGFFITRFKMDVEKAEKNVFNTIIEEGTPEGIVDHIQTTELNQYCIVSTEFGSVLQRMGTKDYELGVSTLYSKLYYGEAHSMMLSQKGKEARNRYLKPGLYVNMFCGMQEATEYVTRTMSRQGLLRRLILIACYPEDIKRWHPPIDAYREKMYGYLWEVSEIITDFMNRIVTKMGKYGLSSGFDTGFSPGAEMVINKYAEKNDKMLTSKGGLTDANIYMQSFWEHLAKLSMLEAIVNESFNEEEYPPRCWVKKEHVEKALDFLNRATQHNREIISSLGREEEKLITSTTPLERVLAVVESAGAIGIKRSELYRRCNMTSNKLQLYLETLTAREQIKAIRKTVKGKTSTFYKFLA